MKKKRALLIGIDEYDFLGKLSFARKDALGFAAALKGKCGFRDNELTVMSCAARGGLRGLGSYMEDALGNLTRLGDLDLLIFGFWGHGFAQPGAGRYLCGMDARDGDLQRSAVSLDVVKAKLAQAGALNTLMILDCCQNAPGGRGAAVDLEEGAEEQFASMARDIQTSRKAIPGKGVPTTAIMNSCREGQRAFEWEDQQHGIFTAHLLDGLAQGKTSIAGLATHVCDHTPETARALYRKEQVPWFFIEGRGDIELPAITAPPPPPPPRPGRKASPQWWVATGDGEKGPLEEAQVLALIGKGDIAADDQCWREGMRGWQEMGKTTEWAGKFKEKPRAPKPPKPPKPKPAVIAPEGCEIIVANAQFAPLDGLAEGSAEAQARQRGWVEKGYPLEIREKHSGMAFRLIPPGEFMMGSPVDEPGREPLKEFGINEGPRHRVSIEHPFMVASHAVTKGQFAAFINATGHDMSHDMSGVAFIMREKEFKYYDDSGSWKNPGLVQDDSHPVVCVNWEDAKAYVKWLSRKTGESYRLLSEAEWEYACRAGTQTPFCFGNTISTNQANYYNCNGNYIYPAGSFPANAFGLHDMHGNVWEWVKDCYHDSYNGAPVDGTAWTTGDCDNRVLRGGSWINFPRWYLRSASRNWDRPDFRLNINGFRVARSLP